VSGQSDTARDTRARRVMSPDPEGMAVLAVHLAANPDYRIAKVRGPYVTLEGPDSESMCFPSAWCACDFFEGGARYSAAGETCHGEAPRFPRIPHVQAPRSEAA